MRDPGSGAGWSDPGGAAPAPEGAGHPFAVAAGERYQRVDIAGRGGMGEVLVARDRRLGREVALKRIAEELAAREPSLAARLAREAWVTARLEHPAIVPVYDAGEDEAGQLFYTMRLVHGQSLASALAAAGGREDRLGLLRHFLAVAHAVGFAHSHGVVHRDLKPANVMVGAFGETQLLDWGLAGFADAATAREFADATGAVELVDPPGPIGTPAYMSPGQAAGGPADPRDDVWSLGAMLHELITGAPPAGPGDPALHAPGVAPALRAIVETAMAPDPGRRYPDGGALAADLARYLDGGRVQAHDYTTLELARRLVVRLRLPLLIAASVALTAAIALALGVRRIDRERHRAVAAEGVARDALADSRQTSGWALARQAVTELEAGALAEAELLGAHALVRGESSDARGAIAAARAGTPPARAETIALPGCERVVALSWQQALCVGPRALALWDLAPVRERWQRPLAARQVARGAGDRLLVLDGAAHLRVLDLATGADRQQHPITITTGTADLLTAARTGDRVAISEGRIVTVLDLSEGRTIYRDRVCPAAVLAALTSRDDGFLAVCNDGAVLALAPTTGAVTRLAEVAAVAAVVPVQAAVSDDGVWLVIGGVRGELVTVDLASGRGGPLHPVLDTAISSLGFLRGDPTRVVVASDEGGARVWDLVAGAELLRVPGAAGTGPRVVAEGVVTGGRRAGRWTLPAAARPRAIGVPVGGAAIAREPTGRLLALARADGRLEVRARASGRIVHEATIGPAVVKTIAFAPDGATLAVSSAESRTAPELLAVEGWQRRRLPLANPRSARRLAFDGDGALLAAHYAPPLTVWDRAGVPRDLDAPEMIDAAAGGAPAEVWLLAVDGGLWRWRDGALARVGEDPGATTIAAWPRRGTLATGHAAGVSLREPDGTTTWLANPSGRIVDLAVSPDERWLVGGRTDGTAVVWRARDRAVAAVLRGHRQRVASVGFAPDGLLYTAGWDGRVLAWNLDVLETPAATLAAQAERAWATELPLALAAEVR